MQNDTHQTSNGKVKSIVNIISATRKNNNTDCDTLRESNNRSTIIVNQREINSIL